jgi:hypothetical protein
MTNNVCRRMAVETMKVNIYYSRNSASVEKRGKLAWVAELTKDGGSYFYSEEGSTIRIAKWQYERVLGNPYAYYFSTALRLHCVCQQNPGFDLTFLTVDGIKEEIRRNHLCMDSIKPKAERALYRDFMRHVAAHPDDPQLAIKANLILDA